jgi:hypothetical protein
VVVESRRTTVRPIQSRLTLLTLRGKIGAFGPRVKSEKERERESFLFFLCHQTAKKTTSWGWGDYSTFTRNAEIDTEQQDEAGFKLVPLVVRNDITRLWTLWDRLRWIDIFPIVIVRVASSNPITGTGLAAIDNGTSHCSHLIPGGSSQVASVLSLALHEFLLFAPPHDNAVSQIAFGSSAVQILAEL